MRRSDNLRTNSVCPSIGGEHQDLFAASLDRMAVKTNPWAVGTSTLINGGAAAILIFMGVQTVFHPLPSRSSGHEVKLTDYSLYVPRIGRSGGGGGGGSNDLVEAIMGRTPRVAPNPITPAQIPILTNPRLAIQPAIAVPVDIHLPDNPDLPNIGIHPSINVQLASNGTGTQAGIGSGENGGDGPGKGNGYGPGSERGAGGVVYTPGVGGVSLPIALFSPDAEFSEEARRAKYQGICAISIVVDTHGYPQNLRVVRSLGMGLDEKALEAVRRYRFKPAMKNGRPVPAIMTIEVNFRLF